MCGPLESAPQAAANRRGWKMLFGTLLTAAAMLALAACGGESEATATRSTGASAASPVASPTRVASPVASPSASPVATPRPATPAASPAASPAAVTPVGSPSSSTSANTIPGLNAATVTASLSVVGANCTGPTTQGANQQWVCTVGGATQQRVEMSGPSATQITTLNATVAGARSFVPIAREFIASVATYPFEGTNAATARQWVIDNIDNGGTTTISGTKLNLQWQGDNLMLGISPA